MRFFHGGAHPCEPDPSEPRLHAGAPPPISLLNLQFRAPRRVPPPPFARPLPSPEKRVGVKSQGSWLCVCGSVVAAAAAGKEQERVQEEAVVAVEAVVRHERRLGAGAARRAPSRARAVGTGAGGARRGARLGGPARGSEPSVPPAPGSRRSQKRHPFPSRASSLPFISSPPQPPPQPCHLEGPVTLPRA